MILTESTLLHTSPEDMIALCRLISDIEYYDHIEQDLINPIYLIDDMTYI